MRALPGVFARFMRGAYTGRTVFAFCMVLIALLWTTALLETGFDRERTVAREMAGNAALVRVLEDTVAAVLRNADQVATMVGNRVAREGGNFDLRQYVRDGNIGMQPYNMISIADEHGDLVQTSRPSPPVNIRDREHFQVHIAKDTGRLFVGKAALGRSTGKWTVYLTRRINRRDGSFGGVAVVGLDPEQLSGIFRRAGLGADATITLIGLDGEVRARESNRNSVPGQDVSSAPLLTRRVKESGHGSYIDTSRIDHITRLFSYRVMQDYPMVMLAGTSRSAALASAERRRAAFFWIAGGASIAILLFASLFIVQLRRQTKAALGLRQELERQVELRTASLSRANQDLESFAYSVSHDLRTPLRAISGFAQILARRQRERLDEQGRHYLDNIVEASGHMGRLIDELLTYSRLGRQAVAQNPVALSAVFAKIRTHLEVRLSTLSAQLTFPPDAPQVQGDEILLYQIFLNLVDNALTYRRTAVPPVVDIGCSSAGNALTITVSDNGIGIEPEHFEAIFGVFNRLHRQDEYPGTGIGLASVKRAVDLLGGRVWVESTPGSGSRFFVRLKRSADE